MLDWKILATVFITLVAVLIALGSHPAVKGFFGSFSLPVIGEEPGNISFTLAAEPEDFSTDARRAVNITVAASAVSGSVKDVNVSSANKTLLLKGYRGLIVLNESRFELRGEAERFEMADIFEVRGAVDLSGEFSRAEIDGLFLREFRTEGSGTLVVGTSTIQFTGLRIESLLAKFVFSDKFSADGIAKRISTANIVVS